MSTICCTICYAPVTTDLLQINCGDIFHSKCFCEYLGRCVMDNALLKCPNCRALFPYALMDAVEDIDIESQVQPLANAPSDCTNLVNRWLGTIIIGFFIMYIGLGIGLPLGLGCIK
jgi:hypothetical protein